MIKINFKKYIINQKKVKFINYSCIFEINPYVNTNTENLYISTFRNKENLYINFFKFNKLKYLFLHIYDLNFINIESCTNLEVLFIYLETSNLNDGSIIIPKNIGLLKNLKHLLTNCNLSNHTHFISEELQTCISNNNNNDIIYKSKKHIIKNSDYYNEHIDSLYDKLCNR